MEVFIYKSFLSYRGTIAHYSVVKRRQNSTKENSSLANLFHIFHISTNLEAQLLDPFGATSSVGQARKQPLQSCSAPNCSFLPCLRPKPSVAG